MDCAKEPLNGAVFLSRMKTRVFYKAFVCGVRIDSHHHAAPFFHDSLAPVILILQGDGRFVKKNIKNLVIRP